MDDTTDVLNSNNRKRQAIYKYENTGKEVLNFRKQCVQDFLGYIYLNEFTCLKITTNIAALWIYLTYIIKF